MNDPAADPGRTPLEGDSPEGAPVPHASEPAPGDARARRAPPRPFDAEGEPPAAAEVPTDDDEIDEADAAEVLGSHAPEVGAPFEDLAALPALLEALLFVADHPIEEAYLARALEVSAVRIDAALEALGTALREGQRGVRLQRGPEGVQLVSAPEAAARIEHFLGLEASRRLSTAALETLAIVAYRQPITRGQIDAIRGVSSDGAVATLRARGLIAPAGYAPGPGRPMLFQTTQRFLEHFGLERPGQLPPLPEEIDLPPAEIGAQLGLDEQTIADALAEPPPALPEDGQPDADAEAALDADGVEIPADVAALSEAAGHALRPLPPSAGEGGGGGAPAQSAAPRPPGDEPGGA